MLFIVPFFFIFSISLVRAKTPNFDMMLDPTIEVYASEIAHCDITDLDFSNGLNSIKGICQAVVESPLCANIHEDYRMDCENIYFDPTFTILALQYPKTVTVSERPEEYELSHGHDSRLSESFSVFWGCMKGGRQFTANIFRGLLAMVQIATHSLISGLKNTDNEKELSDHFTGMNNYVLTEFEKEEFKTDSPPRQPLDLWSIFLDTIQNKYKSFACLSAQGRNTLFCQMALEIGTAQATGGLTGKILSMDTAWETLKTPHTTQAKNQPPQESSINKESIR